jgi:predicted nuclease of predicted toxin-antitoxin system
LKLFFDENLSEKLPKHLAQEFPGSSHPRLAGLAGETDHKLRNYAKDNGFIIVTRDDDLVKLAHFYGAPPKVIWLKLHNPGTMTVVRILQLNMEQIEAFSNDATKAILIIRQPPAAPNP